MYHQVLLGWLAGLFAVMAGMLTFAAVLVGWPVLLVAAPLAGTSALLWYHASGRLADRMRRSARRRMRGPGTANARVGPFAGTRSGAARSGPGPTGSGPGPAGSRAGAAAGVGPGRSRTRSGTGGRRRPGTTSATDGMARRRALAVLDLEANPDHEDLRAAYRRRVMETHPDGGGDEDAFKRVQAAYDALDGGG